LVQELVTLNALEPLNGVSVHIVSISPNSVVFGSPCHRGWD